LVVLAGEADGFSDAVAVGDAAVVGVDGLSAGFSVIGADGVQALTASKAKPAAREIYFFISISKI
jgi:hypothetical protein